ncbi:SDR family oxidoreductase, partial [Pelagibacterales bacterium SAG-MED31]|nr:SDR family oxidoreductase [Pelagibacterales bacterium SAG-MED31]
SLALDLAKYNIRVNAVAPGAVKTGMTQSLKKDMNNDTAFHQRMTDAHPLGRMASPQEIAKTICFLASEDASFITGTVFPVDGGRSIR